MQINKEQIIKIVEKIVNECKAQIYEINFNYEFENQVIQVLIDGLEGDSYAFDKLSQINEKLSEALDSINEINDKYILEVSSAGIERTIKTKEDLVKNVPAYVYCELLNNSKYESFTGQLNKYENDLFKFSFFLKGQPKKVELKWEDIKFIRHAINFSLIK